MERIQESATLTVQGHLRERWSRVAGDTQIATAVGDELLRRWSEPHRRHHGVAHLASVLALVDDLAPESADPDAVRVAVWFHDAVYDPARGDNEERSARLAERALPEIGMPALFVAEVARLVRVTIEHEPAPGDRNAAVLCDADLAILGADRETYDRYAANVREEYGFVPEEAFRGARAAVLRDLLAVPALFRTTLGRARYEEQARRNMRAELDRLEGGIPRQQST